MMPFIRRKVLFAGLLLLGLTAPSFSVTEKWVAGAVSTWTALCSTEVNSLASSATINTSYAVLCATAVANATNLDLYMKVSVSLGSVTPGAGSPYVGVYIYPLNEDGSSYGDGQFTSSAVGPPATNYMGCSIPAVPSTAGVVTGSCYTGIPPTNFKVVFFNNLLVNMASGSNVVDYQTFNRQAN